MAARRLRGRRCSCCVVGVVVLSVSYAATARTSPRSRAIVTTLRRVRRRCRGASLEVFLPRLNAVRAVSDSANRYRDDAPWSMRWGLYQGASVGNAARDAYVRELDGIVLPRFAARVRQRLVDYASEPEKLYVYLKAYLMLGDPKHLDKKHPADRWRIWMANARRRARRGHRRCRSTSEACSSTAARCARSPWIRRSSRRRAAPFAGVDPADHVRRAAALLRRRHGGRCCTSTSSPARHREGPQAQERAQAVGAGAGVLHAGGVQGSTGPRHGARWSRKFADETGCGARAACPPRAGPS